MKFTTVLKLIVLLGLMMNPFNSKKTKNKSKHPCINDANFNLVRRLKEEGYIKHSCVTRVMCKLDRALFIGPKENPYSWDPEYIGFGATLSAPRVHAYALEKAFERFKQIKKLKILDIGSGSGYL